MYANEKKAKRIELLGTPLSPGIAIGEVYQFKQIDLEALKNNTFPVEDVMVELERLDHSIQKSKEQLASLQRSGSERHKEDVADIFGSHIQLLQDETFLENIREGIKVERLNVEYILSIKIEDVENSFRAIDNETVRTRLYDVQDVYHRVLRNLLEIEHVRVTPLVRSGTPPILVAEHLLPSDIALLEFRNIAGIIIEESSALSHIAIITRSFNIPAVINLPGITLLGRPGATVIIDGFTGCVIVNPLQNEIIQSRKKQQEQNRKTRATHVRLGHRCMTRDGVRVLLESNAGSVMEVEQAFEHEAEGIGLLRSEFFYLGRNELPSMEEELEFYRGIHRLAHGRPITIRLLDLGADKMPSYLPFPEEENPQLGIRGIRYLLKNRELLVYHLTSIVRSSVDGHVKILIPFVSIPSELNTVRTLVNTIILKERVNPSMIEIGIMVEVPSVVWSLHLFKNADFFSIGTNDLTQFVFAAGREDQRLDTYREYSLPVIIYMLKKLAAGCKHLKREMIICGEIASDPATVALLMGVGVRALSVRVDIIDQIRKEIEGKTMDQAVHEAELVIKEFKMLEM